MNIKRFGIDVESTATVISNIGVCYGLAVQWRTSQLYWTDKTYDMISVSDLDGNNQSTLISSELEEPRAIALDPDNWGSTPRIEKASLSGQQRVAIITTQLYWPNGIDLDRGSKRIFWVDAGYDRVESADYNGNNRKVLFRSYGLHPFGVALIPPFLCFTDWVTSKEFHMLDATTGEVLRSFGINGGKPMEIVAYDSGRQPTASSSCSVNNGGCSHFCVPEASNHKCVCPTGLAVKQDGKTCEEKVKKFILFADADDKSTNIVSLDVSYFVAKPLFNHLGNHRPIALDYDPAEDRVYWSDVAQGLILSAFANATSLKILFRCNIFVPDGLVIDHVARNIYWTDTGTNRIEVARLDGTSRKELINTGLDEPRDILLDERNGQETIMMYWTDWGANPKVEKAEMDGSGRRSIITGNLAWPNGLTLDQATDRLYWADAKLDTIEMSDLDGRNRQIVLSSSAGIHPYGLTIYQGIIYWTDWNTQSITSYNATSGETDVMISDLQKPMDIHVFDPSLMFSGSHSCSQNNGMCSDLCLLKPGGYHCACPTGVALKADGKECDYDSFQKISGEYFLLFAEADHGEIYRVPLTVANTPCHALQININISRPVAVDYDPVEGKIYWTDVALKLIARAFPNGSSVEVIAHIDVESPDGLAVDYIGRILYWTDVGTSKLEVAQLDGSFRRSLITTGIENPRAIILDIAQRQMYWSDWGSSPKIEQANMDGSSRTVIVSSGVEWVNALALDYHNNLLYWCDAKLDKIERANLQGNNRELVLDLSSYKHHPFGLSLFDEAVYWSDRNNQSIHKYNLTSSQSEVLVYGMGSPMDVHVYNQTKTLTEGVQLKPGDPLTCEGDILPPTFDAPCPASPLIAYAEREKFSAEVNWTVPTAIDNSGLKPVINSNYHPPRIFRQGTYIITYSAEDQAGNKATCSFTIKVIVINCTLLVADPGSPLRMSSCGNHYGARCEFSCANGYRLNGSSDVTCVTPDYKPPAVWDNPIPTCQSITCPSLPLPTNGGKRGCEDTVSEPYDTLCSFYCNDGYSLAGSSVRRCLENGTWSGETSSCLIIRCSPLVPPTDVSISPSSCSSISNYGQTCRLTCSRPGYSPNGTSSRTCGRDGQWTGLNDTRCTDTTPPSFNNTCPKNMMVYTSECSSTALVGWNEPIADDNSGHIIATFPSIRPSAQLSIGLYHILYSASDAEGNRANCTFVVQVAIIACPNLTVPPKGILLNSPCGNTYGSICVFGCESGYGSPGGNITRTCLRSSMWSGDNINCTDILPPTFDAPCPASPLIAYAEREKFSAEVNWTVPTAIDNSGLKPVINSNYHPPRIFRQGTYIITYSAEDQAGNKATCSFTIKVIVINCTLLVADPGSPLRMSSCGNHYGARCEFSCANGYRLNGSSDVTCVTPDDRPPAIWDNPIPTCQNTTPPSFNNTCPKNMMVYTPECSSIALVGWTEPIADDNSGHIIATFPSIRPSAQLSIGLYHIMYSASDAEGNRANCTFVVQVTIITCPNLIVPPKGILLNSPCGNTYGSICVFGCESGYGSPGGNITRTCLGSSMWSGDNINCTDILPPTFDVPCPASPLISYAERGKFSAKVNWTLPTAIDNSGLKPVINSNYHPPRIFRQGTYIITYSAVDQAGNKATCSFTIKVIVINCTLLVADPGSPLRMSSCGNHYGARCEFSCASGFRLNGSSDVICVTPNDRPPAVWDNPIPTCQSITCPSLPIPTNGGKRGCEDTVSELYDTLCSFYCNDGYSLVGSSVRRCLENGTWSGETSLCLIIRCSPLVPPTDISISPSSCSSISNYGQICRLTCSRPGYSPNGTLSRTCGSDGQWTGLNDTRCTDTTPPSFNNTCPKNMMVYTPECSSIALVGWNEPIADDNSGHIIATFPSIRPSAQLSIGLYHMMYSASDAQGNRANCTFVVQVGIVKCQAIKPPSHGAVSPNQCRSASGVPYETHCFLSCGNTPGYQLEGESTVSCLESGSWSADATKTICKDVQPPSIQCPPNQELPTETGQAYAIVTWEIPVPSDNSNMSLSLKGLRPPQLFYAGRDYVRYEVTDSAGLSTSCTFSIHVKDESCPDLAPPENDAKACETWLAGVSCTVHCNKGYGFVNQPEDVYFCAPGGTWVNAYENGQRAQTYMPKEAIVNGNLHYLVDECGDESVNEVIASTFIELFQNSAFGMAGGCDGQCTIDNVEVECGKTGTRRRRETPNVPLTVRFALKVPLPTNASLVDLNQTAELLSNNLLSTLNETDLNLNISGIVIEYDTSRPPQLRLVSLVCGKGQVQRGTQCVNCPLGFYFNNTDCHACPADQYQDQEAESSCMLCPPGRVTFGKIGSKRRENCQEIPSMSSTDKEHGLKPVILYSSVAAGSLVFIIFLIIMTIFCAKKYCRAKRRATPSRGIDMGYRNPVFEVAKDNPEVDEPVYMEIDVSKLSDRNGFPSDNNTYYLALSDVHHNVYERLDFSYSEA
ncbi:Low-density lipoprotein receptor-related protein 6 [Stylophora pistillata]|uniref:Low-density lipoprotein receptor-related protein 6 n=1 Tax=Stylophora pistillata TaxID=50429 RepID=A0A2B4RIC1_STYPI|nr:Low-density lipoprotein receptor-related protein 6 [Stylophora pistillata]